MHSQKIRRGLYQYKNHIIELLNEDAEVYPSNDYYNTWKVTGPDNNDGITPNWYTHFSTKRAAIEAIEFETSKND